MREQEIVQLVRKGLIKECDASLKPLYRDVAIVCWVVSHHDFRIREPIVEATGLSEVQGHTPV